MTNRLISMAGLTADKAKELQEQFGKNEFTPPRKESFLRKTLHIDVFAAAGGGSHLLCAGRAKGRHDHAYLRGGHDQHQRDSGMEN